MTDLSQAFPVPMPVSDFPARKVVPIAVLLVATLIAGWLISGVVGEREQRQTETLDGFQNSWGPEQMLRGPVLAIPYDSQSGIRNYLEIAPQNLKAKTTLSPEERKRDCFTRQYTVRTPSCRAALPSLSRSRLARKRSCTGQMPLSSWVLRPCQA